MSLPTPKRIAAAMHMLAIAALGLGSFATSVPALSAPTQIVAYSFDEGAGATLTDRSGHGYAGALTNGPTWSAGRHGSGLAFDGVNDYVSVGNVPQLNGLRALTVSAWIKFASAGSGTTEVHFVDKSSCDGSANGGPWELGAAISQAHKAEFVIYPQGASPAAYLLSGASATSIDDGNWHFIVGSYDGNYVSIWVDGIEENSAFAPGLTLTSSANEVGLAGHCGYGTAYPFAGSMDDVRIYDGAQTNAEIQNDMAAAVSGGSETAPPPSPQPSTGNLALGKPITATSNDCTTTCLAQFANDGDMSTRNSCDRNQFTCAVVVDLQATYAIGEVKIFWEAACGKNYTVDASDDGTLWRTLATVTNNSSLNNDLLVNGSGRYVRMYGTERCLGYGYSMWEFEVYGTAQSQPPAPPPVPSVTLTASPTSVASGGSSTLTWSSNSATSCTASGAWSGNRGLSGTEATAALTQTSSFTLTCSGAGGSANQSVTVTVTQPQPPPPPPPSGSANLALGKPITATSNDCTTTCLAQFANDGDMSTRNSCDRNQFTCAVVVDLQATYAIGEVKIFWEAACGKNYTVDASDDGTVWRTLATVTNNSSLNNDLLVNGSGRYVRMYGTERCLGYGYSMWEFEVYGTPQSQPPPPGPDVTAPSIPTGLRTTSVTAAQVSLAWQPSTDNVGVAGYRIYRNGAQIGTAASTGFVDSTVTASTTYDYAVSAYDAAGNVSQASAPLTVTTAGASAGASYTTSFDSNENPISEGGRWTSGKATGLDWNNPRSASGKAHASVPSGLGSSRYDDSIAHLNTSVAAFKANQYAQGTVYLVGGYSANHEVELLLRFSINGHDAHGYEVLWGLTGYLAVVRWNGPLGSYTPIYDPGIGSIPVPHDGDVLRAEIVGNILTVKLNGTTVAIVDVSGVGGTVWTSGQPGIGFWPVDGAIPENFGWRSFGAGDL